MGNAVQIFHKFSTIVKEVIRTNIVRTISYKLLLNEMHTQNVLWMVSLHVSQTISSCMSSFFLALSKWTHWKFWPYETRIRRKREREDGKLRDGKTEEEAQSAGEGSKEAGASEMNLASISPGYSHVSIQRKRSNRVHVQLTESTDKQNKAGLMHPAHMWMKLPKAFQIEPWQTAGSQSLETGGKRAANHRGSHSKRTHH